MPDKAKVQLETLVSCELGRELVDVVNVLGDLGASKEHIIQLLLMRLTGQSWEDGFCQPRRAAEECS
jgi:hypothetical protein